MSDDVRDTWKRREPDSPCVNICLIHPDVKICIGCYRTAQEIAGWGKMGRAERIALKDSLSDRSQQLRQKRRGRGRRIGQAVPRL